jgi:hypothetical protein
MLAIGSGRRSLVHIWLSLYYFAAVRFTQSDRRGST